MTNPRLWLAGGLAGVGSICCYILAIAVPWPESQFGTAVSTLVISGFPILGIIASYALCSFVAAESDGPANRLGFIFAVAAFATLLAMIIVQLAVGSGVAEVTRGLDGQTQKVFRRALRLIDHGLDVAWDLLIGTALIFWGLALRARVHFGAGWAYPSVAFGILLIGLNAATFPWPPNTRGLFDIGPAIATFMLVLYGRLAILGRRAQRSAALATPGAVAPHL